VRLINVRHREHNTVMQIEHKKIQHNVTQCHTITKSNKTMQNEA